MRSNIEKKAIIKKAIEILEKGRILDNVNMTDYACHVTLLDNMLDSLTVSNLIEAKINFFVTVTDEGKLRIAIITGD